MNKKIVVLDRDGVINVDLMSYVTVPEDFKPIKGSLEAISKLNKSGYLVAIATNQACINKGIISDKELLDIHNFMFKLLEQYNGKVDYISYCPHDYSTEVCFCRKPETGLLKNIESHFDISLKECFFVGDKETDVQAAINHGCVPLLVETGYGSKAVKAKNCPPINNCFQDLAAAVDYIISK